jgi:hypothetical protein
MQQCSMDASPVILSQITSACFHSFPLIATEVVSQCTTTRNTRPRCSGNSTVARRLFRSCCGPPLQRFVRPTFYTNVSYLFIFQLAKAGLEPLHVHISCPLTSLPNLLASNGAIPLNNGPSCVQKSGWMSSRRTICPRTKAHQILTRIREPTRQSPLRCPLIPQRFPPRTFRQRALRGCRIRPPDRH